MRIFRQIMENRGPSFFYAKTQLRHMENQAEKTRSFNKKCYRNICAPPPPDAKFRFIFSVEAKPVRSK